jgi:hypothetical protein
MQPDPYSQPPQTVIVGQSNVIPVVQQVDAYGQPILQGQPTQGIVMVGGGAELDRTTWGMLMLLSFVTLGIYNFIWLYRQINALRVLTPLSAPHMGMLWAAIGLTVGSLVIGTTGDVMMMNGNNNGVLLSLFGSLLSLAQVVVIIILAFQIKACLEQLTGQSFSGLWCFLFNSLFLAKVITDHNIGMPAMAQPAWQAASAIQHPPSQ